MEELQKQNYMEVWEAVLTEETSATAPYSVIKKVHKDYPGTLLLSQVDELKREYREKRESKDPNEKKVPPP